MPRYMLAALALIALIGAFYHPELAAQLPPGICVAELVTTAGVTNYTCEARAKFTAPATPPFTGQACTPPANGIMLYAKLPDGTCLPIVPVPAAGFLADNIRTWTQKDVDGGVVAQSTYVKLKPAP